MNKINHILVIILFVPAMALAQTPSSNYVVTETVLNADGSNRVRSVQYHDGLGRPSVLASGGMNTSGKYVYTMTEYDLQGRESKIWLASAGGSSPVLISNSQMATYAFSSYNQDQYPFSTVDYDAVGRVVFRSTPGQSWHDSGTHQGVETKYLANEANSVKQYTVDTSGNLVTSSVGYYPAGTLTSEKVKDEDGHTTQVYKDMLGNVVLERRSGNNDTYYVYDKGLLRVVVPPEFQKTGDTGLLYKYKYDSHSRCTEKTLPGCTPIKYWYDRYGRLAFMQDARLLGSSLYRFYLYDGLDRLVLQGQCSSTGLMNSAGYVAKVVYGGSGNEIGGTGYYLSNQLPVKTVEIANYYDGYQCISLPLFANIRNRVGTLPSNPVTTLQTAQMLLTSDNRRQLRVIFYDAKANVTDTHEYYADGSYQKTHTSYTFINKPETVTVTMVKNGRQTAVTQRHSYDTQSGLLTSTSSSVANASQVTTDSYTYDNLGRMSLLGHHGNTLQTAYNYNINGWVKGISSTVAGSGRKLFSEDIYFTDGPGTACYNGNISAVRWSSGDQSTISGYKYTYDGLNRIQTATSMIYSGSQPAITNYYSVEVGYNENGSINSLKRYGQQNNQSFGKVDELSFSYVNGNQLSRVTDAATAVLSSTAMDFHDNTIDTHGASEYGYDGCGSLTYDANKGLVKIEYDIWGYPRRVYFSNYGMAEYVYSADGVRLKTHHVTAVPKSTPAPLNVAFKLSANEITSVDSTEYYGAYIYENGAFRQFNFGSGYIVPSGSAYAYKYYLKDHLGSNRVVVSSAGTIEQTTHYYPYGATLSSSTGQNVQPYKYNGKELDRMHRLNLYDYGARQYDPVIGQFTQIDPLCEKKPWQSPYTYGRNNPLRFIDPDGKDDLDKVTGYLIGIATDIIPFSDALRDLYSPKEANDYNNALRSTDNAFMAIGNSMTETGKGGTALGVSIAVTGGVIVASSGGSAAVAGVPTAVVGAALTKASATVGITGAFMQMNAAKNSSKGYNRGKLGTPKDAYNEYVKGRAPKGIDRIDKPKDGQIHAHQKGKGATNADGTTHDKGKGEPEWSNKIKEWLRNYGFNI